MTAPHTEIFQEMFNDIINFICTFYVKLRSFICFDINQKCNL